VHEFAIIGNIRYRLFSNVLGVKPPMAQSELKGKRMRLPTAVSPRPTTTRPKLPATTPATLRCTGGSTILLVDDDFSVRESLQRVLASEGFDVVTAASGEDALLQLATLRPALVITDLCMRSVSGWDLVFHYHLHEAGLPFFVITALSRREAGGVDTIANRFFQKPLNLDALLGAVREHLAVSGSAPSQS
jgi:CheY-like chemotaxis protein